VWIFTSMQLHLHRMMLVHRSDFTFTFRMLKCAPSEKFNWGSEEYRGKMN
jgi:hypothetical protein